MPDAFLNATEGSNNRSHTTPPGHQNLAVSRLSTVMRKDTALKQYSTTQLKTHKVRNIT